MANNFQNGPGGRLKKEEAKNVNFGFLRPPQRAIAEASTTSIYRPTPKVAEARIYLQNKPGDFKNRVIADIANATDGDVRNMNPENYKRAATITEILNKKYGSPSWQKHKERPVYRYATNSIHLSPDKIQDPSVGVAYKNRPDDYFQELAHSAQFVNNPINSALRGLRGEVFYKDNNEPNVGRYGTPGELEYEAHEKIAPRLWDEYKTLYKKKYGVNIPPKYENTYSYHEAMSNSPKNQGGRLEYNGNMLPEVKIVAPVKRP
jgi:hypothetical protein